MGRTVAILLGTYNGEQHLARQLDSYAAQTHADWEVWASDDGSGDATCAILESYRQQWPAGRLSLLRGPEAGFAANFLALSCHDAIQADYYAYSDQDDIWEADKLERALRWLENVPAGTPALYCARTMMVDAADHEIGLSPYYPEACFANALVQNIAGGNTMVFNDAARALLKQAGPRLGIVYHDWWAYLAVSGCGGTVYCDPVPALRYRQHGANLVGVDFSWSGRAERLRKLWQGRQKEWNSANIAALRTLESRLTPENLDRLNLFSNARERGLIPRLIDFGRSGIYRQSRIGNISLMIAAIFGKI